MIRRLFLGLYQTTREERSGYFTGDVILLFTGHCPRTCNDVVLKDAAGGRTESAVDNCKYYTTAWY